MWEKFQAWLASWGKETREGFKADLKAELANINPASTADLKATLAKAEADLTTAKASIATLGTEKADLTAKLEKAQNEVNAAATQLSTINTQLSAATATFMLEFKADAPAAEKITALQGAVTNTLASFGIDPSKIPTASAKGAPGAGGAPNSEILKQLNAITNSVERTTFYRKNKAAILAARAAKNS